jgi:hypothetical protein
MHTKMQLLKRWPVGQLAKKIGGLSKGAFAPSAPGQSRRAASGGPQVHPGEGGSPLRRVLLAVALGAVSLVSPLALTACGSGGGSGAAPLAAVVTVPAAAVEPGASNVFVMTEDTFGLIPVNFYYSTDNASFWSIQANAAKNAADVDGVPVFRIDIPKTASPMPDLNKTFSIEEGTRFDRFPGSFLVFNGANNVSKAVESGIISFTADSVSSQRVAGTFEIVLTDYDSETVPAPRYELKGYFNFVMGTYGPVLAPV